MREGQVTHRRSVCRYFWIGLFVGLSVLWVSPAQASPDLNVFVPGDYVPLSEFKECKTDQKTEFSVKSEIINYVLKRKTNGWLAYRDAQGVVRYQNIPESQVDPKQGKVWATAPKDSSCVVVADEFRNDYPIVTHWDQSLNKGRGGHRLGASDQLGFLHYDPVNHPNKPYIDKLNIFNPDLKNPYSYYTEKYALFSGDPKNPEAKLPDYERYVGENYAIFGITPERANKFSDDALKATGFPVRHVNAPWAFDPNAPVKRQVLEGVPVFQVVHCYPIAVEPDKGSLATFLLPPNWSRQTAQRYPVLFNGFYDINQNLAQNIGHRFLTIIGELYNHQDGSVVGILWNGGGSLGTYTLHQSAYQNAAKLFETAAQLLNIDPHKIVATGMSRGGMSALMAAANPDFGNNYTIQYVLANSPGVKIGEHGRDFINPSYPSMNEMLFSDGYKYSWKLGWKDPQSGLLAYERLMKTVLGTTDPVQADLLSPFSDNHMQFLKKKGSKIILAHGTNDSYIPSKPTIAYFWKLRSFGIPTNLEIMYRAGHTEANDVKGNTVKALKAVITGKSLVFGKINHYRRKSEKEWQTVEQFFPEHQPVVLEAPAIMAKGQTNPFTIVGGPETDYFLQICGLDVVHYAKTKEIRETGCIPAMYGSFPKGDPLQSATWKLTIPQNILEGYGFYKLFYKFKGESWQQVPLDQVPKPIGIHSLFIVTETEDYRIDPATGKLRYGEPGPTAHNYIMATEIGRYGRGWGLSSE